MRGHKEGKENADEKSKGGDGWARRGLRSALGACARGGRDAPHPDSRQHAGSGVACSRTVLRASRQPVLAAHGAHLSLGGRKAFVADYETRLEGLRAAGVALWDTIGSCERAGSLDSSIRSAEPNDVAGLLARFPTIETVILNGGKSAAVWRRHAERAALAVRPGLRVLALPSTSPANARLRLADLEKAWRAALQTP